MPIASAPTLPAFHDESPLRKKRISNTHFPLTAPKATIGGRYGGLRPPSHDEEPSRGRALRDSPRSMLLLLAACAPYPEGLRATPDGDGPLVVVDWDAKPLPELPFPNDLATRSDPTSPTGLRVNIPTDASTAMDRDARQKLNSLSGFGVYAPISVAFSAPLDLDELAARHRDDPKLGAEAFTDDAVFVIDVTPDSPDYGKPVALDLGRGRFPYDVPRSDRYFPNDSRAASPTLVFDTVEEDLNGNGVLDWGEDTDNDGVLDHPNVYPDGGDARENLLTFYEKESNSLLLRVDRPLREKTTYAVVLTNRLVGVDGNPVRSPWPWVNHLQQTEALRPLEDALPDLGLATDDVAFAWTFTTGDVTGDLRGAREGLLGKGPLASLDKDFPEGVFEAEPVDDIPGTSPWALPVGTLLETLVAVGLFDGAGADVLVANYGAFASTVVGGAFHTPNFFADPGGTPVAWPAADDSDDVWQVDAFNGTYSARSERVVFTCVLPKDVPQPAPVVMFGHGYGSSRFDFLGFAWAFNRMGYATCAFDYPGHGPTVDADQETLLQAVLGARGLLPFYTHLKDSRYRDLDNDGVGDSGGDQWTADAFHTRDMVRQAALDHAQFVDSLRACGTGKMTLPDGSEGISCDWDGDGTPDIGGPDVEYDVIGGSLGGINTAVAAGVIDEVKSWSPIVAGGGLLDVAVRTEIGGAVEAMHGRLISPLFVGYPQDDGSLQVVQIVNSVRDMVELPVATIPSFPAGGKITIENLDNGEVAEGYVPVDGRFRLGIPADAPSAWEKKALADIPEDGAPEGSRYPLPSDGVGDRLRLTFTDASGNEVAVVDQWAADTAFQGATYVAGAPLVAAAEGLGKVRGTPDLRRTAFIFGAVLEGGDPIAYARRLTEDPFDGNPRNMLLVPTPGDSIVSVNAEIALARGAGWLNDDEVDDRYGTTVDRFLVDHQVVRGLEEFGPYTCANGAPCLFDADDLDNGTDDYGAQSEAPLRLTFTTAAGTSGMRLPYVNPNGQHGFAIPEPDKSFDMSMFMAMQIASYFKSGGQTLSDDPCLEDASCAWIPQIDGGGDTGTGDTGDTGGAP